MKKRLKGFAKFLERKEKKHKVFFAIVFALCTLLLFLPIFIQIKYQEFRTLGLIGVFLLNALGSATVFLPAPAFLSVGISATQSDPLLVSFIAALGSSIGESATFLFGFSSTHFIDFKKHKTIYHLTRTLLHKWNGLLIPVFSFIPNPVFDGLGILAGITHYPIKKFIVLTFIGRFLRNILIAYFVLYFR